MKAIIREDITCPKCKKTSSMIVLITDIITEADCLKCDTKIYKNNNDSKAEWKIAPIKIHKDKIDIKFINPKNEYKKMTIGNKTLELDTKNDVFPKLLKNQKKIVDKLMNEKK